MFKCLCMIKVNINVPNSGFHELKRHIVISLLTSYRLKNDRGTKKKLLYYSKVTFIVSHHPSEEYIYASFSHIVIHVTLSSWRASLLHQQHHSHELHKLLIKARRWQAHFRHMAKNWVLLIFSLVEDLHGLMIIIISRFIALKGHSAGTYVSY